MGFQMRFLATVVVGMVLALALAAHAKEGIAIYEKPPYIPSACFGNHDQGIMITSVNEELFDNRAACGKYYEVKCTAGMDPRLPNPCKPGSVIVKVVDLCGEPCNGDFLLSEDAMREITNEGKIHIEYNEYIPVKSSEPFNPIIIEGGPRVA